MKLIPILNYQETKSPLRSRGRCHAICLDATKFSQKEAVFLEVEWFASRRIMSVYKAKHLQRVEYPNASLPAARATVIPDTLQIFAFCAPMFTNTSHHANIRRFVCFGSYAA
mmetsp:Transcript_34046/g.73682  ORF Transcript_34046/g.73682 Transcript_34046/m.73682 type:complete len:112 (+) Transcript_34046:116-451(+)